MKFLQHFPRASGRRNAARAGRCGESRVSRDQLEAERFLLFSCTTNARTRAYAADADTVIIIITTTIVTTLTHASCGSLRG
jgi:hypothetical protein